MQAIILIIGNEIWLGGIFINGTLLRGFPRTSYIMINNLFNFKEPLFSLYTLCLSSYPNNFSSGDNDSRIT